MTDSLTYKDFLYHLTEGHYQSALDLSKELDIDTDIVYKAQWESRLKEHGFQLTKQDIDLLETIHDDAWVTSQCLQVITNDSLLQERILKLGYRLTCQHTDSLLQSLIQQYDQRQKQQTEEKEKEWFGLKETEHIWLGARSYFLQYSDRLKTFLKIWPLLTLSKEQQQRQQQQLPTFLDVEGYEQFRDVNLVAQAIEFARTENNQALDALFIHHGDTILPQRLFILEQVPETVDPASFDLPHVTGDHEDKWVQEPWRSQLDPVELPWIQSILKEKLPVASENTAYLTQLDQNVLTTPYPASAHEIAQWYLHRAKTMDLMGLPSHALGLVRYAKAMGVPEMDDFVDRYDWLCKYIYASTTSTLSTDFVLNLEAFEQLPAFDVLEGFLLNTTIDTIVNDMKRLVVPWLERCTKKLQMKKDHENGNVDNEEKQDNDEDEDEELPIFLLYRWLLDISTKHLGWCCVVFEASKPTIDIDDRIIKDDCDLSRLVLSMVYSSDGSIEFLVRMFECLPIFNDLDNIEEKGEDDKEDDVDIASLVPMAATPLGLFTALQSVNKKGLTKMMDTLQSHLMSAEVLYRYHASVPLSWYLQDQSLEVQRQLCTRMASQAAGGVETGGSQFDRDDDWRELLDDMLRLYDNGNGIFGKLTSNEIMKIFYTSLLRCGQFKLARSLMLGSRPLLEYEEAEKLVIEAEYEFFDNSTTGNMNNGNMKKAMDCLQVLPPTFNIKKEMDLIEATHSLISVYQINDKPGILLMPIQLRQSTNRLELISKLVNTRKGIYRQFKDVIALTKKLGYQDDVLAEVTVLAMMAGAAMVDHEFIICYRLCQVTIEKAQSITTSKKHNKQYVEDVHQAAWQICFNLGKLDAFEDVIRRMDALAMALTVCPVEYTHDILLVYQQLEEKYSDLSLFNQPLAITQLEPVTGYDDITLDHNNKAGWHGLLESAKKRQWIIGDLLKNTPSPSHQATSTSVSSSSPSFYNDKDSSMNDHQDVSTTQEHEHGGKRKRDQLKEIVGGVGGWLFQQ